MGSTPLKVIATARADQRELAEGTLLLVDNQIDQTTGTDSVEGDVSKQG